MTTTTAETPRMPPTRRLHALEERDRITLMLDSMPLPQRALVSANLDKMIERRVRARAGERHRARVQYASDACVAAYCRHYSVAETGNDDAAAAAIALLALLGQGGPGNAGGPEGASQLPLLPVSPIWQHKRQIGGAWCAALREVARGRRLAVYADRPRVSLVTEPLTATQEPEEVLLLWDTDIRMSYEFECAVSRLVSRVIAHADESFRSGTGTVELYVISLPAVHGEVEVTVDLSRDRWPTDRLALEAIICASQV